MKNIKIEYRIGTQTGKPIQPVNKETKPGGWSEIKNFILPKPEPFNLKEKS